MGFDINTVTVSGNLTRDPELRATRSGDDVCSLRIAHNARVKVGDDWQDKAHYFNVTVWKGQGRWIAENIAKGQKVTVSGRLQFSEWQAQDGSNRSEVSIVAVDVVPERSGGGNGGGSRSGYQGAGDDPGFTPASSAPPASSRPPGDDDIPF